MVGVPAENTHKDQCGVQVLTALPDEIMVILVSYALELVIEFDPGTARRSE